jgi:TonB-dependent receptor
MHLDFRRVLSATSVFALAIASQSALAQDAAASGAASTGADAAPSDQAIVVTGLRASLRDALNAKRNTTVVAETISSKDIGVLPDVTIADSLGRLPGVTATRDRGNASQAAVRGLGPRLVLGLINGREVASSEPDRNVRWEIYPSEIVSGVTVYKAQSADFIAGGVAATIDIQTIKPLDYHGPAFTVRGGAIYNDGGRDIPGYSGLGARGSAQYVGKLTDDLGLVLGGTYQRQKNGFESFQGWGYNTVDTGSPPTDANGNKINTPWGAQSEVKGLTETRWSTTAALQWKPGSYWDITLDGLYSNIKIDETQAQQWYGRSNGWGDWGGNFGQAGDIYQPGNYTLAGNTVTGATLNNYSSVTNVFGKYTEDKTLFVSGLNAKYDDGTWSVKTDVSYSSAKRNNLYRSVATEFYPSTTTFASAAGQVPSIAVSGGDSANIGNTSAQTVQSYYAGIYDGPQRLHDDLGAGQIDIRRAVNSGWLSGVGVGLRYSNRVKSLAYGSGSIATVGGGNVTLNASDLTAFNVRDFSVPTMVWGNFDTIAKQAVVYTPGPDLPTQGWRVREDDMEGYVMADLAGNGFSGNVGVRFVDVVTHSTAVGSSTSWDQTANNGQGANVTVNFPIQANNHYFRALPSINLNFELTQMLKLRLGAARVISRPPLDELRANRILSVYPPQLTGSAGNPNLRPFMATQGDVSVEWYFHKDALLAVAGYYKDVDTNIGYAQTTQSIGGADYLITGPANGKGGYIAGVETTLQTPFWFIPGLDKFGIYANAAFVKSDLKELSPTTNPFPAVGLADFTGEVDLWYSDHGIDARVALKHHSPFTVIYGWDASKLTRLESETTLGASIGYSITKNISVRVQANNLTNQVARFYWNNDANQIARYEKYGRSYLADVTVRY